MKDFQDFCDSLDQDFIDDISSDTSYALNTNVPLVNKSLALNYAVTMRILERYHAWLQDISECDE